MAPSRWTPDKNEALLNAFGKTLLKTATGAQKTSIEDNMREAGHDTTWEAIRLSYRAHQPSSLPSGVITGFRPVSFAYSFSNFSVTRHQPRCVPSDTLRPFLQELTLTLLSYPSSKPFPSESLPSEAATMSSYAPKTKRNAYVPWDADMHEDILCVVLAYFDPTKSQYEDIHRVTMEMGHMYTPGAMSRALLLSIRAFTDV
ncbi:hypothetical protein PG994_001385 [Apiospora phragmitis]|uniref:Uncharacterized protein n=1 Tax=Apiospora phragmitis TaxID=2905665 RepID=A0ABR1WTD2_9PEZI